MKVVPQSFEHLPDSPDHIQQIGSRARICYQSEPKDNEAGFVQGLITSGHNSCLEMAVIHLFIDNLTSNDLNALLDSNYIIVDQIDRKATYCTGSIRAWREFITKHGGDYPTELAHDLHSFFCFSSPSLFWTDLYIKPRIFDSPHSISQLAPQDMPAYMFPRHEHIAMKIVTNRAVTHELVRHRPCSFLQESQRYVRYDKPGGIEFIAPSAFFEPESNELTLWESVMENAEDTYRYLLKNGTSPQAARLVLPNSCKTEIIVYTTLSEWEHILAMRHHPAADPSMQELMAPLFDWFSKKYPQYFPDQKSLRRSVG